MVHGVAVAVAVDPDGPLVGVLFQGASGAGKSLAALSLITECRWARSCLVADDCVIINNRHHVLNASAPSKITGRLELRGFGLISVKSAPDVILRIVFDLDKKPERMPSVGSFEPFPNGPWVPLLPFDLKSVSSISARVTLTLRAFLAGQIS